MKTVSSFSFLVLSVILVLALGGAGNDDYNFSLSSSEIVYPGTEARVNVQSYRFHGTLRMRVYRIPDPVAFFKSQEDPHSPRISSLNRSNMFDIMKLGMKKIASDTRVAIRAITKEDARRALLNVVGLPSLRKELIEQQSREVQRPEELREFPVVKEWNAEIPPASYRWGYHTLEVNLPHEGVYLVEGSARDMIAYTVVIVSKYGLVTKRSSSRLVCFVAERRTGKKVDDFPLYVYQNQERLASGYTVDGMFSTDLRVNRADENAWWEGSDALILGYKDQQFIISDPAYYGWYDHTPYRVMNYTERPAYRPGQTVYFKSIIRKITDVGRMEPLADVPVQVKIYDSRYAEIFRDTLTTNALGTLHGEFKLGEEPPLGSYAVAVVIEDREYSQSFRVEEYKKPEYEVKVVLDKKRYARGDSIRARIQSTYFFGSPVSGGRVEYFVFRSRYYKPWWKGTEFEMYFAEDEEMYSMYRREMVASGTGLLDNKGEWVFTLPSGDPADLAEFDYVYSVQANVEDASRRAVSGSARTLVTRGLFSLSLRTDSWMVQSGEKITLHVATTSFDGEPVSAPYEVKVFRYWWERRETRSGNEKKYRYFRKEELMNRASGRTGSDGTAKHEFRSSKPGSYLLEVWAKDSRGNRIREETSVYVTKEDLPAWWNGGKRDGITIIPDKDSYEVGETMHALVTVPAPGLDVLIATEADDILDVRTYHFATTSRVIDFEMTQSCEPNVFFTVAGMWDDQFYQKSKKLLVLPREKFLHVSVESDRRQYEPGATGTLDVRVADYRGQPVADAEVSIGVVDEALYALYPERTIAIEKAFYPLRWNGVETSSSTYFYFRGEIIRAGAMRTAMRHPFSREEDPMWRERLAYGDVKGDVFQEPSVRKDFRDMILWLPEVRTDSDGKARVRVKYPDNLTSWRATVRAVTFDTRVGAGSGKSITRKDFLVRLETPRVFREGDDVTIATTVHNYLESDKEVSVRLGGDNVGVAGNKRVVIVPANGIKRLDWRVTVGTLGEARLTVTAQTAGASDGVQVTVPVLPKGIPSVEAQTYEGREERASHTIVFKVPDNARLETAALTIGYSPSVASSLLLALDDLVGYPYGCVEQTMSRFLPTLLVARAYRQLKVPLSRKKVEALPEMVRSGLGRLYGFQHYDGGWGWWKGDESDPYMTGYVVYGMLLAKQEGYNVDLRILNRGVTAVTGFLQKKDLDPTTEAYLWYIVSMSRDFFSAGRWRMLTESLANRHFSGLNNCALALYTLAYSGMDLESNANRFLKMMWKNKTQDQTGLYWQGKSWHYNWQDDEVETTAYALKAMTILHPQAYRGDISSAMRWLMAQRRGNGWRSTRQTSTVISAVTDYLLAFPELEPEYHLAVSVNGSPVLSKDVKAEDVYQQADPLLIDKGRLKKGDNIVTIVKEGSGSVYLTARLRYYTREHPVRARSHGFVVEREYYRLDPVSMEGSISYLPRRLRGPLMVGDLALVKLRIYSAKEQEYVMLEDPFPGGVEVLRSVSGYRIIDPGGKTSGTIRSWWIQRELRDEKVAYFFRRLEAGKHTLQYIVRAYIPGRYTAAPAVSSLMYYPEYRGSSAQTLLEIMARHR
ncbi:MAG: hypothetical protein GXO82_04235 [Chlorobi bacterium]|nr:hypothetical protein [Chlorobiota bacterium]